MSHNTPLANAEFQLAFTETNLRWLLGETPQNPEKIAETKRAIEEVKARIELLKSDSHNFGDLPGEGVTLVYRILTPKGSGPDYSARFWGRNEEEAKAKANAYLAQLPAMHTPAKAVERRIGR